MPPCVHGWKCRGGSAGTLIPRIAPTRAITQNRSHQAAGGGGQRLGGRVVGIGVIRAALIVAAVLAFTNAMPAASSQPLAHGRELVAQYRLPAEILSRYAALRATQDRPDALRERAAWIDHSMWVGPLQQVGTGRNPYTLVLTVSGHALTAGEIRSNWQAGWEVRESPVATREVLMSVTGIARDGATAGAPVTLTAVGSPVSFRGERYVAPMLNLVNAHNLDITDVDLQVWSGSAPLAWTDAALSRPGLVGVGMLCLLAWWRLGRFARRVTPAVSDTAMTPAPAPQLPLSDLDLAKMLEHRPAAPTAAPAVPAPAPAPAAAPRDPAARVVAALHDVLTMGLAVHTELDTSRTRRRRKRSSQGPDPAV
jgi:hypothetical protein